MAEFDWKAVAALVGAGLGIINLVGSIWAKRPLFTFLPHATKEMPADGKAQFLMAITTGAQPLLLRSTRLFPRQTGGDYIGPRDDEDGGMEAGLRWQFGGPFHHLIPANESRAFYVSLLKDRRWRILCIRWSNQTWQPFPWTIRLVRRRLINELNAAGERRSGFRSGQ